MDNEFISRGERTRADIISAAYRLFIRHGYHGTSMREITKEAGISLGAIYNHFESKEDLFSAVLEAYHPYHEILPAIRSAKGDTIEAFVKDAARYLVSALDRRPDFLNLMFIEIVEFKSQHVPRLYEKLLPQIIDLVQVVSRKGGELRPIPLPMVIRAFIGLFFSYQITEILLGKQMAPELRENALDHFVEIFLYGIAQTTQPIKERS